MICLFFCCSVIWVQRHLSTFYSNFFRLLLGLGVGRGFVVIQSSVLKLHDCSTSVIDRMIDFAQSKINFRVPARDISPSAAADKANLRRSHTPTPQFCFFLVGGARLLGGGALVFWFSFGGWRWCSSKKSADWLVSQVFFPASGNIHTFVQPSF